MTAPRLAPALVILLAGLAGAAGVALSAVAAHVEASDFIRSAAAMCLAHAPVLFALALPGAVERLRVPLLPAVALAAGVALFAGDMTLRAFPDTPLFAMAAPTGGMLMIGGWVAMGLLALVAAFRPR